jgi:hypothetical protein
MRVLAVITLLAVAQGCRAQPEPTPKPEQAHVLTQKECLVVLTNKITSVTLSTGSREHVLPIRWITVETAQTCSRPLDLYLKDIRIGAFVDWSSLGLKKYDDILELSPQLRNKIADALKPTPLPKTRILIAGEATYPYEGMKLQNN